MSMVGIFPASVLGIEVEKRTRKVRKHTAHQLHIVSSCPNCDTPLLFACTFKNSRGTGFCVYTEAIEKHHRCSMTIGGL